MTSVVVLEESPCPRGPIYESLSLSSDHKSLSLDHKVLENCQGLRSVMYDHVKSINSVTVTIHEDTVKNVLLTDVRYYLVIYTVLVSYSSL